MPAMHEAVGQLGAVDRFVLLLLGAGGGEPIPGPVHLQNGMYMLSKVFPELAAEARFGPGPLGARSVAVEARAAGLEAAGLVEGGSGGLALTARGREARDSAAAQSDRKEVGKAEEFKEFLSGLSSDELAAFVCLSYPEEECAEKESGEYGRLASMRWDIALSLYRKDKVSAQKAAQMSGECFEDFFDALKNEAREKDL